MFNWIVTLVNTIAPFDTKQTLVRADTVQDCFDEERHGNKGYYARSARACPESDVDVYMSKMVEIAGG